MPAKRFDHAWQGEVVQILGAGAAIVKIPRLTGSQGGVKCRVAEGWWTPAEITATAGPDLHAHGIFRPLAKGDQVIVQFLEGRDELAVITGRLL